MSKYELLGGGFIDAASPRELVEKLNEQSKFGRKDNLQDFMNETAKSCQLQNGARIRTKNFILFVADLKAGGFLKELDSK